MAAFQMEKYQRQSTRLVAQASEAGKRTATQKVDKSAGFSGATVASIRRVRVTGSQNA